MKKNTQKRTKQKINKQAQYEILQLVNNPFTNLTMVNFHTGVHASGPIDVITETKTIETFWVAKFYHTILTFMLFLYIYMGDIVRVQCSPFIFNITVETGIFNFNLWSLQCRQLPVILAVQKKKKNTAGSLCCFILQTGISYHIILMYHCIHKHTGL